MTEEGGRMSKEEIKKDARFDRLLELWVKWNRREITGDDFAYRFGNIYPSECGRKWRKKESTERIQREMML